MTSEKAVGIRWQQHTKPPIESLLPYLREQIPGCRYLRDSELNRTYAVFILKLRLKTLSVFTTKLSIKRQCNQLVTW
ncbi:carbon monoxide dehydrogenase [Lactobacillus phage CV244]|nr:carbon monoxide dehydrogenase [Lactobacillus phage CV244]